MSLIADTREASAGVIPLGYPAELERDYLLSDGRTVHVRPVLPEDAAHLEQAIERLGGPAFFGRIPGYSGHSSSPSSIRRLAQVDYRSTLTLVAFSEDGRWVGMACYDSIEGEETAQVAIAVQPLWRRLGIGAVLVRDLASAAIASGLRRLRGHLLTDDRAAEALVRTCGYGYGMVASEGVAEVEIELTEPTPHID